MVIDELRQLENLAFAAWPAEEVERADGWRLRWTRGVTRRANSVWPNETTGDASLSDRIARAEGFYAARGAPPMFQISPAAQPGELDAELAARAYAIDAPVSIQILRAESAIVEHPHDVRVEARCANEWFDVSARQGRFTSTADVYRALLERIGPRALFAWARVAGEPVGVGLGVVEGGWLGVFSMLTLPAHRKKGVGRAILSALVSTGVERGASNVYLQVERDNHAAVALYASAGFRHAYGYHYRVAVATRM